MWSILNDKVIENSVDEPFLRAVFEVKKKKKAAPTAASTAAAANTKRPSMVLQGQRLQNIGITLKRLKKSKETIARALITCDTTTLDDDALGLLASILATPEDMSKFEKEKARGDIEWGAAEECLYFLGTTVMDARERIQLWQASTEFSDTLSRATKAMETLEAGVGALSNKFSKFSSVLRLILGIGNVMNRGTSHANAKGFRLEALGSLSFIKGTDGKTTVLESLVHLINNDAATLKSFPDELKPVELAVSCPYQTIAQHVQQLNHTLQKMRRVADEVAASGGTTTEPNSPSKSGGGKQRVVSHLPGEESQPALVDGLPPLLSKCTKEYTAIVGQLTLRQQTLREDLTSLMDSFGEDFTTTEETVLWKLVIDFMREYQKTQEMLVRSKRSKEKVLAAFAAADSGDAEVPSAAGS